MSAAKLGSEQCLPLRGKQPHERVCEANWRRSLCAAKRLRTPAGVNGRFVGAAYMPPAAYRGNPSTGKGEGCRPPLPLSSATHLWHPVGAGHARPSTLPLPPMCLLPLWPASPPAPPDLKHKKSPPSGCGSGWGLGGSGCVRGNHVPELRLRLRNPVPIYYRITAKKLCFSYEQFVNYRAAGPNATAAPFFVCIWKRCKGSWRK